MIKGTENKRKSRIRSDWLGSTQVQGLRVRRRRYLLQMMFDLFKDGVGFESLQVAA